MDKKRIKEILSEKFIRESATPGIDITASMKKKSGAANKAGVKAIEKDTLAYDKDLKQKDANMDDMALNKFNYTDDFEKTYHDEMEIMNGQEMIQYDRKPDKTFLDRAKKAIEGDTTMGNGKGANAEATWGASSDDFGKKLAKRIKASAEKRSKQTPTLNLRGMDIQADIKDTGHKPYAIEESENKKLPEKGTPAWHQLQVAKKTLKNTDAGAMLMGGMSKDEANKLVKSYGVKIEESDDIVGNKESSEPWFDVVYYATVGQHGSIGNYPTFDTAIAEAIKFYKREKKEGTLKELECIDINSNTNDFAIIYMTQSYINSTEPIHFKEKQDYSRYINLATKVLETGKPMKGKFSEGSKELNEAELKKGKFTSWCKANGFDGPSASCAKKAMSDENDAETHKMATFYMNTVKPNGETTKDIDEKNNKNNTKENIKESMKRLRFNKDGKAPFNGLGNALKLIPEGYRTDSKEFEMTDGNETYRIRWEGNLSEGKAIVLTATNKKMVQEDLDRMKQLFNYKSEDTLGLVKGKSRIDENQVFGDIYNKTKKLFCESEDIDDQKAKEGEEGWVEGMPYASEAKKNIEGSVPKEKQTNAPTPKEGHWDKIKGSSKEATKDVTGSVSKEKQTNAPKAKEGDWDVTKKAPEATEHIESGKPSAKATIKAKVQDTAKAIKENEDFDNDNDADETEDNYYKGDEDDSQDDKEPTASDVTTQYPIEPENDGDDDNDDEGGIAVPPAPSKTKGTKLMRSQSTGMYFIVKNGSKPVLCLPQYIDLAKKNAEAALLKMEDDLDKTQEELDEYGDEHAIPTKDAVDSMKPDVKEEDGE